MRTIACQLRIALLAAMLVFCAQFATALDERDLDIKTPAIMSLQKAMASRFFLLKPYLEAGIIGLTHDGAIALRDAAMIDGRALLALDALIIEENKDRATLYREIARANQRPEWESNLRTTFGNRWIDRMPTGWFHRSQGGQWIKK